MPDQFKENAEDLNTGDSVQVNECAARAEPPELAAIRERVERDFVTDPASVSGVLSAELMQARIDRRALLANFDAELAEHAKPAPEMPRPPAEEADPEHQPVSYRIGTLTSLTCTCQEFAVSFVGAPPTEAEMVAKFAEHLAEIEDEPEPDLTLIPAELIVRDPEICSGRPTMRGTRILAEMVAGHLAAGTTWEELHEWYPSMPVPAAQPPASGPETAGTGSGRGTGVTEVPGTAQVGESKAATPKRLTEPQKQLLKEIRESSTGGLYVDRYMRYYRTAQALQRRGLVTRQWVDSRQDFFAPAPASLPSLPVPSTEEEQ